MTFPAVPRVAWRTSTRSNQGGNCVEVAALDDTAWRTSTRSNQGGECVQAASTVHVIAVRDSKDPAGPHLDFSPRDWQAFTSKLKVMALDGGPENLA